MNFLLLLVFSSYWVLSNNRWDSYPLVWCVSGWYFRHFILLLNRTIPIFFFCILTYQRICLLKDLFSSPTSGMTEAAALKWPLPSILLAHPHLWEWVQLTGILHWAKCRPYWCQLNSATTSDVCLNLWLPLCFCVDSDDIHALQMEKRWKSCQRSIKKEAPVTQLLKKIKNKSIEQVWNLIFCQEFGSLWVRACIHLGVRARAWKYKNNTNIHTTYEDFHLTFFFPVGGWT